MGQNDRKMDLIELYKSETAPGTLFRWMVNVVGFVIFFILMILFAKLIMDPIHEGRYLPAADMRDA